MDEKIKFSMQVFGSAMLEYHSQRLLADLLDILTRAHNVVM